MAFITALINRIFDRADNKQSEPKDHYEALEFLRKNHDWIDVTVTQTQHSYQSMVLDIDAEHHELLIDELYPATDVDKLQPGDTIEINSRSRRVQVSFYTRILAHEVIDGKEAFRVELPEEVGRNHSRQAYRVYVQNEEFLSIDVPSSDIPISDPRIINLSTEGIKLSFAEDIGEQLNKQRHLKGCLIKLPDGFDIDCDIELRNIYHIRTPHPHSLTGGVLTIKHPQQRVKLEQYLASVQRKQRRRESRVV